MPQQHNRTHAADPLRSILNETDIAVDVPRAARSHFSALLSIFGDCFAPDSVRTDSGQSAGFGVEVAEAVRLVMVEHPGVLDDQGINLAANGRIGDEMV